MPTAQEITDGALSKIRVKKGGIDPSAADTADAIRRMNLLFGSWAGAGIDIGAQKASNPEDETNVPDFAQEAVEYALGARLATEYGYSPTPAFALEMRTTKREMLNKIIVMPETLFPKTLPVGAGNFGIHYNNSQFYNDFGAQDLLSNDGVALETEEGCILRLDATSRNC